jgi:UDP-glucose 4-epimerase
MNILITGGRGFIGAAVAREATSCGHHVIMVDNSIGGRTPPETAEFVRGDITNPEPWRSILRDVDVVIHSAAIHHSESIKRDPIGSIRINLHGTRLMLDAAAGARVRRFVYLSSAKIYGEPLRFPSCEDDLPNPAEPYGLAKAVGEQYCRYFQDRTGMRCISIRPFSVYGPGQDLNTGYIGQLIQAMLSRDTAVLSGDPNFVRDFVYIDDVVNLCMRAATADHDFRLINAGSGQYTSLDALVALFADVSGVHVPVQYKEPSAGTIIRTLADIRRASQIVPIPPVRLAEGLRSTISWALSENKI